jgi:hypothetical protein
MIEVVAYHKYGQPLAQTPVPPPIKPFTGNNLKLAAYSNNREIEGKFWLQPGPPHVYEMGQVSVQLASLHTLRCFPYTPNV